MKHSGKELITYPDDHILLFERSMETEDILLRFNVRDEKHSMSLPAALSGQSILTCIMERKINYRER